MTENGRLDALRALLEQVEAGTWPADFLAIDNGIHGVTTATMYAAFSGSLDAAKALHEAVLPGWEWRLRDEGAAWVWRTPSDLQSSQEEVDDTARAWLICIIRALIEDAGE
mgnify:CR=1 FL=1